MATRQGLDNLARDCVFTACEVLHVHANVNIRNEVASTEPLKFVAFLVEIYRPKNDIAIEKLISGALPFHGKLLNMGGGIAALDLAFSDINLEVPGLHIFWFATNKAWPITFFDHVIIDNYEITDTDMAKLLAKMGTAPAITDKAYDSIGKYLLRIFSKERLSRIVSHHVLHFR